MLKYPFLNIPYQPKLRYFLGPFDIYDREETLGKELETYDINNETDRERLIKKYIIDKSTDLNYRHRKVLVDKLSVALNDETYNFSHVLRQAPGFYCSLPRGWSDMVRPRGFFEDIYRLANEWWKTTFKKPALRTNQLGNTTLQGIVASWLARVGPLSGPTPGNRVFRRIGITCFGAASQPNAGQACPPQKQANQRKITASKAP